MPTTSSELENETERKISFNAAILGDDEEEYDEDYEDDDDEDIYDEEDGSDDDDDHFDFTPGEYPNEE